jgi:diadenosine tetraphosphate (Ap4A) HIT family hydrolase
MPRVSNNNNATTPARADDAAPAADASATNAADGAADAAPADGADLANPDLPAFSDADARPTFRVSVRPPPVGQRDTPLPKLKDDWQDATVDARAKELATDELINTPEFQQAFAQEVVAAEQQEGRPLTNRDKGWLQRRMIKQNIQPYYAKHYGDVSKNKTTRKQAVADSVADHTARVQSRRDPFLAVIQGDPAALAKERVLFEDPDVLVVVDFFAPSPKALVVPKKTSNFPGDLTKKELDKLAFVSQQVSQAFTQLAGSQAADIWINPPQALSLSRLHVHVQPHLPRWEQGPRAGSDAPDPALVAEMDQFWTAASTGIAKQLQQAAAAAGGS